MVICGPSSGPGLSFAGPPSVHTLASAWAQGYAAACPDTVPVAIMDVSSSADGAARVCGTRTGALPVDLGGLSRPMQTAEAKLSSDANQNNHWQFDCERSRRSTIQVDVAVEGVSVFTKNTGPAFECIQRKGGLTLDQLRWMYSNFGEQELQASGTWDGVFAVPYSDRNDNTHLWSELFHECASVEILMAGQAQGSLAHKYFTDNIFSEDGETIVALQDEDQEPPLKDTNNATLPSVLTRHTKFFGSNDIQSLIRFLEENDAGLAFFGLGATLSADVKDLMRNLEAVPILNEQGDFTKPEITAIEDSAYALSRRLFMHVYNNEESLARTRPFIEFAYSSAGRELVHQAGFWPIQDWESLVMRTRLQTETAIALSDIQSACGPKGGSMQIDGSSTIFPILRSWSAIYQIGCDVDFPLIGRAGSSTGAGRVCDNPDYGTPVDMGAMSRAWKESEALPSDKHDFLYECVAGDQDRSAVQIDVGLGGIVVAVKQGGAAAKCVEYLGGGLSADQLRWIFTSYTDSELEATGWDPSSLKNSDGNSGTHLWDELDARCEHVEIRLSSLSKTHGTAVTFQETILVDNGDGEDFGYNRPGFFTSPMQENLVGFVEAYEEAIAFMSFVFYNQYGASLKAIPLEHEGKFVEPSYATIQSGAYNLLARALRVNLLDDDESLIHTVPFVKFGLEHHTLMEVTGNIPVGTTQEMTLRLDDAPYNSGSDNNDNNDNSQKELILVGVITGASLTAFYALVALAVYCCWWKRRREHQTLVFASHNNNNKLEKRTLPEAAV